MTVRQIYNVNNNQLLINLPDNFKGKQRVMVTIDDEIDTKNQKLATLQSALNDPLYLLDIKEINDDFFAVENNEL